MAEWPPNPVVLDSVRPARNRGRQYSEHPNHQHQSFYYHDGNGGLLVPAEMGAPAHRAHSMAATRRPASIVINNTHWDDHSPGPSPRDHGHHRHSSHGHDRPCFDEDDWDHDRGHSPAGRRRAHSHAHSRSPSPMPLPMYDHEFERRMRKLEELEEKEKEEHQRKRFEEERIIEEARQSLKKKEMEEMKKKTIEEYKIKEAEEKLKKEKKQKEEDEIFKARAVKTLVKAGYSEESAEKMLKKAEKSDHGHGKEKKKIMDLSRPTYIKVHRKHLSPDSLDEYDLPWEWDERDSNYIVIKRWIPEHEQDVLFEHTRKLRDRKRLTDTTVELKKERDNLLLVRRKSPGRKRSPSRSYMFT